MQVLPFTLGRGKKGGGQRPRLGEARTQGKEKKTTTYCVSFSPLAFRGERKRGFWRSLQSAPGEKEKKKGSQSSTQLVPFSQKKAWDYNHELRKRRKEGKGKKGGGPLGGTLDWYYSAGVGTPRKEKRDTEE